MTSRNIDALCDVLAADAKDEDDGRMLPIIELARQFLTDVNRIADALEETAKVEMHRREMGR